MKKEQAKDAAFQILIERRLRECPKNHFFVFVKALSEAETRGQYVACKEVLLGDVLDDAISNGYHLSIDGKRVSNLSPEDRRRRLAERRFVLLEEPPQSEPVTAYSTTADGERGMFKQEYTLARLSEREAFGMSLVLADPKYAAATHAPLKALEKIFIEGIAAFHEINNDFANAVESMKLGDFGVPAIGPCAEQFAMDAAYYARRATLAWQQSGVVDENVLSDAIRATEAIGNLRLVRHEAVIVKKRRRGPATGKQNPQLNADEKRDRDKRLVAEFEVEKKRAAPGTSDGDLEELAGKRLAVSARTVRRARTSQGVTRKRRSLDN